MAYELRDYFETRDGSRPETKGLDEEVAKRLPLAAFTLLRGGDVFEGGGGRVDPKAQAAAASFAAHVELVVHGADPAGVARDFVISEVTTLLAGNSALTSRLAVAKPLKIDVAPGSFAKLGLPRNMSPTVAGVFWDAPDWVKGRIALRMDRLFDTAALVAHELGHAVFYLALTDSERRYIYDLLRPTFGSRASMDEAFAIYTEREVQPAFSSKDKEERSIYGLVRRQWSEDHLFTRFIRKLYFPNKPLAGPGMGRASGI